MDIISVTLSTSLRYDKIKAYILSMIIGHSVVSVLWLISVANVLEYFVLVLINRQKKYITSLQLYVLITYNKEK